MPIVLLGSDNLAQGLRELGQDVLLCSADPEADIVSSGGDPEWATLNKTLQRKGITPRAILVSDQIGGRTLPTGLWGAAVPTIFYGVDAPLNQFWHTSYAQLFDIACLDQLTQAHDLSKLHPCCQWLPVAIDPHFYQDGTKIGQHSGACFVGVVDDKLRPKRSAVLTKISGITSLTIKGGRGAGWFGTSQAVELYQSYQITVNENLFAGVTTRPLEVMAAGGCLLSEAAPGQMDKFFAHREHLCYYTPATLSDTLAELLADSTLRTRLRVAGRQAVLNGHTFRHRSRQLLSWLSGHKKQSQNPIKALANEAEALLMAGMRWREQDARRLLRARGRLRVAAASIPSFKVYWLLGLNEGCLGQMPLAAAAFNRAAEQAQTPQEKGLAILAQGLALYDSQQNSKAKSLLRRQLNIAHEPGQPQFHMAAAQILLTADMGLCPGFSRSSLWMGAWTALEHLLLAVKLSGGSPALKADALFTLGELLLANKAPNQAYECLSMCKELGCNAPGLEQKLHAAAEAGYLL